MPSSDDLTALSDAIRKLEKQLSEVLIHAFMDWYVDCIEPVLSEMMQDFIALESFLTMRPKRKWPNRCAPRTRPRRLYCKPYPIRAGREIRAPTRWHRAFYHRETIKTPDCM